MCVGVLSAILFHSGDKFNGHLLKGFQDPNMARHISASGLEILKNCVHQDIWLARGSHMSE